MEAADGRAGSAHLPVNTSTRRGLSVEVRALLTLSLLVVAILMVCERAQLEERIRHDGEDPQDDDHHYYGADHCSSFRCT